MGSLDPVTNIYNFDIDIAASLVNGVVPITGITTLEYAIYVIDLNRKVNKIDGINCYSGYNNPTFRIAYWDTAKNKCVLQTDYIRPNISTNYKVFVVPLGFIDGYTFYYNDIVINKHIIINNINYLELLNNSSSKILTEYYDNSNYYTNLIKFTSSAVEII